MKYVIAGFGAFGRLALERLRTGNSNPEIIIIDSSV
jgi:hypothetical protein